MGARGSRAYVGSNNGKITTVVTAFCDNNDNSIIDVQRHRELSGVSPAPSPPEEFSDVIPVPGPSGAAPLIAGGLDPKIQVMIDILEMSVMLRRAFPKVRRLALIETLRRCPTVDDAVNLLLVNLLNLKSSAYMSSATKVLLAQRVRDHDWTFLQQKFVLTSSQPTNESVESDFDKCRYMLACIFSCSRTMQTLASARRRRIGMTIHSCTDMEHFLELVMHSLVTSGAFTEAMRAAVVADISENRFDKLLLPDRFDCIEKPRGHCIEKPRVRAIAPMPSTAFAPEPVEEEMECVICMGDNKVDTSLPCGHQFCTVCINEWLQVKRSCPMCRRAACATDLVPIT